LLHLTRLPPPLTLSLALLVIAPRDVAGERLQQMLARRLEFVTDESKPEQIRAEGVFWVLPSTTCQGF
jgi:hypothetical protein